MNTGAGDTGAVGVRLQKLLAEAGVGSRRYCERLIQEGRVRVDGVPATLGARAARGARIELDGKPVVVVGGESAGTDAAPSRVYIALNKPDGVITSARDQFGRKTVMDLVACGAPGRVFPVGRLDYHTKGLLLLTDDGDFAFRVTHPGGMVEKAYEALTDRPPGERELRALRGGVALDEGFVTSAARARIDPHDPRRVTLVIHEGKNRQVRRMFEAVGLGVRELTRVAIGGLALGGVAGGALGEGEWRRISREEARRVFAPARISRGQGD